MPNDESRTSSGGWPPDRKPLAEIAKRAGEAGAGLAAAAQAVAVKNAVAEGNAYHRRVADTHRAGMNVLGFEAAPNPEEGGDVAGGDIIVTGDIYGDAAVDAMRKPDRTADLPVAPILSPEPPSPAEPQPTSMSTRAKAVVLGAAAMYAGTVGLNLASYFGAFDKEPPPTVEAPEFSDRDTYPGVVIERPDATPP